MRMPHGKAPAFRMEAGGLYSSVWRKGHATPEAQHLVALTGYGYSWVKDPFLTIISRRLACQID